MRPFSREPLASAVAPAVRAAGLVTSSTVSGAADERMFRRQARSAGRAAVDGPTVQVRSDQVEPPLQAGRTAGVRVGAVVPVRLTGQHILEPRGPARGFRGVL